jgi:hypothetical protein
MAPKRGHETNIAGDVAIQTTDPTAAPLARAPL